MRWGLPSLLYTQRKLSPHEVKMSMNSQQASKGWHFFPRCFLASNTGSRWAFSEGTPLNFLHVAGYPPSALRKNSDCFWRLLGISGGTKTTPPTFWQKWGFGMKCGSDPAVLDCSSPNQPAWKCSCQITYGYQHPVAAFPVRRRADAESVSKYGFV